MSCRNPKLVPTVWRVCRSHPQGRKSPPTCRCKRRQLNLKTAKALGIDVPLQIQQLADEVIE
jgi:hypothetical protein